MSKMIWPPERTVKYEFNSLDRDFVEIKVEENTLQKPKNVKGGKVEDNEVAK